MEIIISNSRDVPIYKQIKNEIKNSIIAKELKEEELLPSIRALAKDLKISVMTVKKSYDELEEEGFIVTVPGKGSFVKVQNLELIREEKLKEIEMYLEKAIVIAKELNITKEEILNHYIYLEEVHNE